jgi:hypothetical protein
MTLLPTQHADTTQIAPATLPSADGTVAVVAPPPFIPQVQGGAHGNSWGRTRLRLARVYPAPSTQLLDAENGLTGKPAASGLDL